MALHKQHPKIAEFKRKIPFFVKGSACGPISEEVRARVNRTSGGLALLDNRQLEGYAKVWGVRDYYGTKFVRGCCTKSIRERGPGSNAKMPIKFCWQHDQGDPLGLFEVLEEDEYGLYFRTMPLDDEANADRALRQVRSGTLNNYSDGFDIIWHSAQYDDEDDSIVVFEEDLYEISIVTLAANQETYTMRSMGDMDDLMADTDTFLSQIPRKLQLEARQLFSRYKSLTDFEPSEHRANTLNSSKPVGSGIDYDFLLKNL